MIGDNVKLIIILGIIFGIIYFIKRNSYEKMDTIEEPENEDIDMQQNNEDIENDQVEDENNDNLKKYGDYLTENERGYEESDTNDEEDDDENDDENEWFDKKYNSRNKSKKGKDKMISYNKGVRGHMGPSEWSKNFQKKNNVIGASQYGDNDDFKPKSNNANSYAEFKSDEKGKCGSNQNCEPEELFDSDKYLPQEVNDDWFEVTKDPISVKNRHLINITKPIGVNTIGTSMKNASHDIRSAPACPKTVVSPFLNSSIEPDTNIKQF